MKTRIAIYGGTDITNGNPLVAFVQSLTKTLLGIPEIVIVSGGFDHKEGNVKSNYQSVDKIVLNEAKKYQKRKKLSEEQFSERFETWIPERNDRPDVIRFEAGKVIKLSGSSQSRRFKMVQNVDAIVTIGGKGHTRSVIELALAIYKPVIPTPFSGGDSQLMWLSYKADIIKNLTINELLEDKINSLPSEINREEAKQQGIDIAKIMNEFGKKICLVLMRFSVDKDNEFYINHLKTTIEGKGYTSHRIDQNDKVGNIPDLFFANLERAKRVIVDITGYNANVMYELGHVHSKHIQPLILRRESELSTLPFYLLPVMVHTNNDDNTGHEALCKEVEKFLESKYPE